MNPLKGFDNLGDYSYDEILTQNLIMFLDWGFINKGGFTAIDIPSSGSYGGDYSRLRPVVDPRFTNGQVWESVRSNWVWESGLEYSNQPLNVSGVYINGAFSALGDGTFYIDYPNGRVVFNDAISVASNVQVPHSFKWVQVLSSQNVPWLRQIEQRSHRVDNSNFLASSGVYQLLRDNKLQLPAVAVETAGATFQGYQLGGGQYCRTRIKFYVIGEEKSTVDRLADIIGSQNDKTIYAFDPNLLAEHNRFPLDYRGAIASGALTYNNLVSYSGDGGFRFTNGLQHGKLTLMNAEVQPIQELTTNLYQRVVTLTVEGVRTKI